jgi:hypothetical protein
MRAVVAALVGLLIMASPAANGADAISECILTTADGNGADDWTNANVETEPAAIDHLVVRSSHAKAYLRFDLAACGMDGRGPVAYPFSDRPIVAVTLSLTQLKPWREKPLNLFAVNLNRRWMQEGRLGPDWPEGELLHENAPASGTGGAVSVRDRRSLLIGKFEQSSDFVRHVYSEKSSDAETPLLDYLNGLPPYSRGDTAIRVLVVAEASEGEANSDFFASKETAHLSEPPTLTLTFAEAP